jgi:hypothetical protein
MNANEVASPPPSQRRGWLRPFSLPGFITIAAFVGNELLMAAIPWRPFFWAVPYFPLKAVGIPLCGLVEAASLVGAALTERSRNSSLRTFAGLVVVAVTVWINWQYDPRALLDFIGHGTERGEH